MMEPDQTSAAIYQTLIKEKSPEFFCDNCGFYPIEPMHGHFRCPQCFLPTKCCEGMPLDIESADAK